jgi:uncharacterized radical SAM superfamily Fe-S cluster-containing enzyme
MIKLNKKEIDSLRTLVKQQNCYNISCKTCYFKGSSCEVGFELLLEDANYMLKLLEVTKMNML